MEYSQDSVSVDSSEEANNSQPERIEAPLDKDEYIKLSDSIFLYPSRKMTPHGNVFEGEIRSGVSGVRPCAIKFAKRSEENVREARILTKLCSHTHVISIIQSGVYKDVFEEQVYIALDKCHKQNLRQYFEHRKESGLVYDVNIGLKYSKQIIAGVTYIHENLIFHKDLKPSNILLTLDRSTIKLADFGLSQEIKSTSSKVFCNHQFGTNGFRSPESFGNSWASMKSDVFSLAVVFYFMLSNGMSPLGEDFHLWTHNTKTGLFDISGLLVPNPKSTEHLIKLMLSQERCRRPSIWQVADHPCWTGKDVECNFDYGHEDEIDDSDMQIRKTKDQESNDSATDIQEIRKFLRSMEQMGFRRLPAPESSIMIFDCKSKHLQRFNPGNQTVTQVHEFNDEMNRRSWSSVSIGNHIYVLMRQTMYRLKHCDVTIGWEQVPDLIEDHGNLPPAVVMSGAIVIAGAASFSSFKVTKAVTKYDPSLNRWERLKDKRLITRDATTVASQRYVYCLGGRTEDLKTTDRVERFSVVSQSWDEVSSMRETRWGVSAVEYDGKLIVAGGNNHNNQELNSVEKYDPDVNQWMIMKPMNIKRWGSYFRCHLIGESIYAVGQFRKGIEKYDFDRDEWKEVRLPGGVEFVIVGSVA